MSRYLEVKYRKNWLIKLHSQRTKRKCQQEASEETKRNYSYCIVGFLIKHHCHSIWAHPKIKCKDYGDKQVPAPRKSTSSVESACMCASVVCLLIQRSSISCRLSFVWPAKRSQPITATKGFSRG